MKEMWILQILCSFLLINTVRTADVCEGPFSQFLQCMARDAETRLDNYNKEITPASQSRVQQCFLQSGCPAPDFTQAQVGFFVQEPWTSRINAFLALLENMDPKVQRCMTDYFKGILASKINECVKKHGPKDVRDFQMPPIPGGYNIDTSKMKTVFLDRMMVQYQSSQCPAVQGNILGCAKVARQETDDGGMCRTRENCVRDNIKDDRCHNRFDKVHATACQCFNNEQGRKNVEKDVKNTILSGNLEKQFKQCHQQNGVPYPQDKVDAAKAAAKAGFMEWLQSQGQLPSGVDGALKVAKQVVAEMSTQWKGAFCAECTADVSPVQMQPQPQFQPQPQLAASPLVPNNQFQPAIQPQFQPSVQSQMPVGSPAFVVPPPLPPQASFSNAQQPQPQAFPAQQNSQLTFDDFKQRLAETFGPLGG